MSDYFLDFPSLILRIEYVSIKVKMIIFCWREGKPNIWV